MSLARDPGDHSFLDGLTSVTFAVDAAGWSDAASPTTNESGGLPRDPAGSPIKRLLDVTIAALALLAVAPLLCALCVAIKISSPGPVLFRQKRYGLHNRPFEIYKLRTMYVDRADPSGVTQTRTNDERVTPLGAFLRRFNLDELPQLLNVLKGDMSLVGPRPHVPDMLAAGIKYETLVPYYFDRHRAKPGITGLAQAHGFRGSTEDADLAVARIKYDVAYIQSWSIVLDLKILARTLWYELKNRGRGV